MPAPGGWSNCYAKVVNTNVNKSRALLRAVVDLVQLVRFLSVGRVGRLNWEAWLCLVLDHEQRLWVAVKGL